MTLYGGLTSDDEEIASLKVEGCGGAGGGWLIWFSVKNHENGSPHRWSYLCVNEYDIFLLSRSRRSNHLYFGESYRAAAYRDRTRLSLENSCFQVKHVYYVAKSIRLRMYLKWNIYIILNLTYIPATYISPMFQI